jgi:hypothetical protein
VVLRDYLWCNGGHGGDDGGLMYCGVCVCVMYVLLDLYNVCVYRVCVYGYSVYVGVQVNAM